MRKLSIFAFTAMAVINAAGSPLLTQASAGNSVYEKLQKNDYIVIDGIAKTQDDFDEILTKLEEELGNYKWNNCIPNISIPGIGLPETPEQPENGDSKPETPNQPENENSKPEDNVQESTFAEQVVKLVNEERAKAGLKELTLDKTIGSAALIRAKEIEQSFSHTRPNGSNFSSVLKEQGITYRGAGENIAWGQTSPEAVMKGWMNSEGHRANILNPNFTKIGVGHYQNAKGTNYWAQLFTY